MARNDWTALVTDPAQEYFAQSELLRFGFQPYLPQIRKRWLTPRSPKLIMRCYPLFPRYILLSLNDARSGNIHACQGLRKHRPILADAEGHPYRIPEQVILALKDAETSGYFDDVLAKGDKMRITSGSLS